MQYIYFNSRDEFLRMNMDHIVYFEADGNYTHVTHINGLRSTIALNFAKTEQALSTQLGEKAQTFIRLGRSLIVNQAYIYKVSTTRQEIILSDTARFVYKLTVSKDVLRRYKELILSALTQHH